VIAMKNRFAWVTSMIPKAKAHWSSLAAAFAAVLLLQSYFVRVLLASELFFALVFAAVLPIGGAVYLLGAAGASWLERSRQNMERVQTVTEGRIE